MAGPQVYFENRLVILLTLAIVSYAITACQSGQSITFVIPPGTQEKLEAGEEIVDFPNEITLNVGDTIFIENQDSVVHSFGPFTILPNTTLTKRFETARVYESTCTFHQNKQMKLVVKSAGWNIFQYEQGDQYE